jgi:hypothetical protein
VRSAARLSFLCAVTLLPIAAHGSFGGGTPCKDFFCFFVLFGILLGVSGGIPVTAAIFAALHLFFCNPARSKVKQFLLGGLIGMIAFAMGAAAASLIATWEAATPGGRDIHPAWAYGIVILSIAFASVLYARSSPGKSGTRRDEPA